MNSSLKPGDVVIVDTGQSGCITHLTGQEACVLLLNRDLWDGQLCRLRKPQDQADLDACPLNVERKVKLVKMER